MPLLAAPQQEAPGAGREVSPPMTGTPGVAWEIFYKLSDRTVVVETTLSRVDEATKENSERLIAVSTFHHDVKLFLKIVVGILGAVALALWYFVGEDVATLRHIADEHRMCHERAKNQGGVDNCDLKINGFETAPPPGNGTAPSAPISNSH